VEIYLNSPNTPSWCGAQLKEAQGQLYLYPYTELNPAPSQALAQLNAYIMLVGKPLGRVSLGRSKRRWRDNIKMEGNRRQMKLVRDRSKSSSLTLFVFFLLILLLFFLFFFKGSK
jgi:hypothetical protein